LTWFSNTSTCTVVTWSNLEASRPLQIINDDIKEFYRVNHYRPRASSQGND